MKRFKTLYKKTSTGAIQQWKIWVDKNVISTEFGQIKGKKQIVSDTIKEGKNVGKSNETTPVQQASLEAKSQWDKKIKKGYVEETERAEGGETNIAGGVFPMLAQSFAKHAHKIRFPAYVQPKLDGHRCIADNTAEGCDLWSRTRKPILGVPNISNAVRAAINPQMKFDGELYNHEMRDRFEELTHFIRQVEPKEGHQIVQYHVYDIPIEGKTFKQRVTWLEKHFPKDNNTLKLVETRLVKDEQELMEAFRHFTAQGYEGAIVRNADSPYVYKRSYDLQKIKEFDDAEYKIINIKEGRGKLAGHVGSFLCETEDGTQFEVKMRGAFDELKKCWDDHSLWTNKYLTVQYQGLTGKNNVPRFPVGLRMREDV